MKKLGSVIAAAFLCLYFMASCGKNIRKETYAVDGTETGNGDDTVTTVNIVNDIGPLLRPYDDLVSGGEYTLKITFNEVIGGESVPTVTTSVHHNGTMKIKVEESYGSETVYFVEGDTLYYYTSDGEQRHIEYDPGVLNVYLYAPYDSCHELTGSGDMTLYGKEYRYEKYRDKYGKETAFLFSGTLLERKLVYNGAGEPSVYTVELTEYEEGEQAVF